MNNTKKYRLIGRSLSALLVLVLCAGLSFACGDKKESNNLFVTGIKLTPPDGFTLSKDHADTWLAPNYSTDAANINIVKTEGFDGNFNGLKAVDFSNAIANEYKKQLNVDVPVKVISFEHIDFKGVPAIKASYEYELEGVKVTQLQYSLNSLNAVYVITFTESGDKWAKDFQKSAEGIVLETKK